MDSRFIIAEHFSNKEAMAFVSKYGLSEIPIEVIDRYPLLMQYFRGAKCKHWKEKYIIVFLSDLEATLRDEVEKLTASSFKNLSELSELQAFSQQLTDTSYHGVGYKGARLVKCIHGALLAIFQLYFRKGTTSASLLLLVWHTLFHLRSHTTSRFL